MTHFALSWVLAFLPGQSSQPATSRPATPGVNPIAIDLLQKEAKALEPLVKTDWVKQFLRATNRLPAVGKRLMLKDETKGVYFSRRQAMSLGTDYIDTLMVTETNEVYYYYTKYGSPLAYARALDVLGQRGFKDLHEKKILDFGFGSVGQLRLLASLGARVVGVDVDPLLRALYDDPMDQGPIEGPEGRVGTLNLLSGRWPAEERMRKEVGDGYDLVISKDTLKMGFIHPQRKTEDRFLLKIGVDDAAFVKALYDILKPGGLVLIYNLCPAPSPPEKTYIPWSDGRCPFPRALWESAGFEVLEFDKDDTHAAKNQGYALGWNQGPDSMDLEHDLFASYTLLRKKAK